MWPKTDAIWHARSGGWSWSSSRPNKIARSPGPTISCSIVDNQSPPLLPPPPPSLYTLRLFAKRGQCDFSSQPPRNSLLVYNYRYAFRLLFSVTLCGNFLICLSSLLLFISLAWLSLGFSVSVSLSGPQRALLRFCCQAILQRLLSKLRNVTAYA